MVQNRQFKWQWWGNKVLLVFPLLLLGFVSFACQKNNSVQFFAMGTVCSISLQDYVTKMLFDEIEQETLRIEALLSSYMDNSEIGKLNREGQNTLSTETFALIEQALDYAEQSQGRFDPSIGPLSQLWDVTGSRALKRYEKELELIRQKQAQEQAQKRPSQFSNEANNVLANIDAKRSPPSSEAIEMALSLVSYRDVKLDQNSLQVHFARKGMKLDLGSIAKGYVADQIAKILQKANAPAGVIDLGGNILLYGTKDDGVPWSVGIRGEGNNYLVGMFISQTKAVVTSGIYQRYYMHEGKRYHHILSTQNGYPLDNGMFSVTVVSASSVVADVLSTVLFIYGVEKSLQNVAQRQANGEQLEALFITEDKQVYSSSGFARLSEEQYKDLQNGIITSKELPKDKIWLFPLQEQLQFTNVPDGDILP